MSVNKGINETQRVPQQVIIAPSTEIIDSIRTGHMETVEMLSHVNHTLSMYKLQISDLKAQLGDHQTAIQTTYQTATQTTYQTIMQDLQNIKESQAGIKSDIENIKNTISEIAESFKNTKKIISVDEQLNIAQPTSETLDRLNITQPTSETLDRLNITQPTSETLEQLNITQPTPIAADVDQPKTNDNLSNLLNNNATNESVHTTDNDLLTQLTSEPQKVTVAVPKASRGRRPRK